MEDITYSYREEASNIIKIIIDKRKGHRRASQRDEPSTLQEKFETPDDRQSNIRNNNSRIHSVLGPSENF
jgi:hypothetical protein